MTTKTKATKFYIKFIHPDDVLAIDPLYNLVPDGEPEPVQNCPKCGEALYIPVVLPEEASVSQAMGELWRLNKESSDAVISEPELPVLGINKSLSYREQLRLKQFKGILFVNDKGFEMSIGDVSFEPMQHRCK